MKGGQRRVYLKLVQGTDYVNPDYAVQRPQALAAGLKVGAYDFLDPLGATPQEAATYFTSRLSHSLVAGRDLRPALDCELGTATPAVGVWISEVAALLTAEYGFAPLIYGSAPWLAQCAFKKQPGPLWIAAYGRNDGKEHSVTELPPPWKRFAAHQFTSTAVVPGIVGKCDLSRVASVASVEVPKKKAV